MISYDFLQGKPDCIYTPSNPIQSNIPRPGHVMFFEHDSCRQPGFPAFVGNHVRYFPPISLLISVELRFSGRAADGL